MVFSRKEDGTRRRRVSVDGLSEEVKEGKEK
jgi:hypothetical protein